MPDDGVTLQEIDAGANACSVEWCPIAGLERYVACSTYALESADHEDHEDAAAAEQGAAADALAVAADTAEGTGTVETSCGGGQRRTGRIVVHELASSPSTQSPAVGEDAASAPFRLQEAAKTSLDGGVLDAKWSRRPLTDSGGAAVLACATSTGRLILYALSSVGVGEEEEGKEKAELRQLASSDAGDSLLLSLDWSGGGMEDAKVVVSQSDGALAVWRPHPNGGAPVQEVEPWSAHTLRGGVPTEAWIAFFKRSGYAGDGEGEGEGGSSFVVSGADDALMKGWDLRAGGGACGASPAFVCKGHGAGVTAGQWHPTLQHTFVSGSYDEAVRIWDARSLRVPVSTTATGGGLWRLKWHPDPERGNLLLAACMHAGMRVLDTGLGVKKSLVQGSLSALGEGGGEPGSKKQIVSTYTRHASMAYGADWCRLPILSRSKRAVIASCSFYDSLFCLWQTPPLWSG